MLHQCAVATAFSYVMPCYRPLKGYKARHTNPGTGKRSIVFNVNDGFKDLPQDLPCGQCIGCRLERSRQWALRCVHEAQFHDRNCFITLTYNDDHLPVDCSLDHRHYQLFLKRFRKAIAPQKIRNFMCGEYGDKYGRPHYHSIIFGYDFDDKVLHSERDGIKLYKSAELQSYWSINGAPIGYVTVGAANFLTSAYVARYITKKINGEPAEDHYTRVDAETGEYFQIKPEYTQASRSPGIAREWYEKFKSDCYPSDFVTQNGIRMRPPKFYDSLYELDHREEYRKLKAKRIKAAKRNKENNTPERLAVREEVKHAQFKLLKRGLE